jgi:hypothetical protein
MATADWQRSVLEALVPVDEMCKGLPSLRIPSQADAVAEIVQGLWRSPAFENIKRSTDEAMARLSSNAVAVWSESYHERMDALYGALNLNLGALQSSVTAMLKGLDRPIDEEE